MNLDPLSIDAVLSGQRRDLPARLLRGALAAATPAYAAAVLLRNLWYDRVACAAVRAELPVISIGNLTVGGTGKTPHVLTLAEWLTRRGLPPAVLCRGYRAAGDGWNDEALELRQALPELEIFPAANRAAAARAAARQGRVRALLLDDGFQHRRLARDLDLVLIDATEPWGFGHLLPRGLLREPTTSLRRADAVILTRCDQVPPSRRTEIRQRVARGAPRALWLESRMTVRGLLDPRGTRHPLDQIALLPCAAFAGIGNPRSFEHIAATLCRRLVAFRAWPDHHRFNEAELSALSTEARRGGAAALLCTRKDLVKIPPALAGILPTYAVEIEPQFEVGWPELETLLVERLPAARPTPAAAGAP